MPCRWFYCVIHQSYIDLVDYGMAGDVYRMDNIPYYFRKLPVESDKRMYHNHYFQVLVFTGVSQIRYLNRALMRFDSKVRNHPFEAKRSEFDWLIS